MPRSVVEGEWMIGCLGCVRVCQYVLDRDHRGSSELIEISPWVSILQMSSKVPTAHTAPGSSWFVMIRSRV